MKKNIKYFILTIIIVLILPKKNYAKELDLSAKSFILMDEVSGRVLVEVNSREKLPMASTTKIMTALVAIENGNLEDKVKIDSESAGVIGSSIYLRDGEILSLKDLLYGLMLRSGNDSAVAIAKHIGGEVDAFVDMMNKKAKDIHAFDTSFANPHGLDEDGHYTTSYDLALITKEAFKNPLFRDIACTKSYKADRIRENYFLNKNKTLWDYDGADGVKIGYTHGARRCLVSTAKRNNMRLIAVSLNAKDWYNDNYKLFDHGFENYRPFLIYNKGQFMTQVYNEDGEDDIILVSKDDFIYPLTEKERDNVKIKIIKNNNISVPIIKGDRLGKIETYINGKLIKKGDLIAKYTVEKKSFIKKLVDILRFNNV